MLTDAQPVHIQTTNLEQITGVTIAGTISLTLRSPRRMTAMNDDAPETQEQTRDTKTGAFQKSKVDPLEAYDVFEAMAPEERSAAAVERIMRADGRAVSGATISRWRKKHDWDERVKASDTRKRLEQRETEIVDELKQQEIHASDWGRVLRRILMHCESSVSNILVSTPEELEKMVEVGASMQTIIGDLRGDIAVPQSAHEGNPDLGSFGSNARHLKAVT